ncbi:MAG TPA: phosphopantetheine-binding protein [Streptosporangiaceae bacterium]
MSTNAVLYDELVGQVRQAWADVLGTDSAESVPLDVNFLEVGGNSMLLVMLWEQLRPLADRQLRLSELFQHGTVRAQAELLSQAGEVQAGAAQAAPAARTPSGGRSLLAQRRSAGAGGVD